MASRPVIFGTAGHIDHGKTTLVRALTGTDTDRLPEEKARGISIDLGFAPWTLPSGRPAAFVDVPGHERFVRNMVAGVHGMDAVVLVIAADEGVMPQTREHLAILSLLGVGQGLTVLTKRDLVEAEWLELVREETLEALRGTFLGECPVLAVSAVTGEGLPELREQLDAVADRVPPRDVQGSPRLPIDRVFSVRGFGTVVTGTLTSGRLRTDDNLAVMPDDRPVRVRGLEVHGRRVDSAEAGQRVAVNLGGVERQHIRRGQVLSRPGAVAAVSVAQIQVTLLPEAGGLKHRARVHVHAGTDDALARVYYYDRDRLDGGDTAWAELRIEKPLVLLRGDRVLLRSYSPVTTIGGGVVGEVGRHHRRREAALLDTLDRLVHADPATVARDRLAEASGPRSLSDLARESDVSPADLVQALAGAPDVVLFDDRWAVHRQVMERLEREIRAQIDGYHADHPLRRGIPRERLRALAPTWDPRHWNSFLAGLDGIRLVDDAAARADFQPNPGPAERSRARNVEARLWEEGLRPTAIAAVLGEAGVPEAERSDFLAWMVEEGLLVRLDEGLYVARRRFDEAVRAVRTALADGRRMGTSELREVLGTSRKYAVPLLERMDEARITRRVGDERMLMLMESRP